MSKKKDIHVALISGNYFDGCKVLSKIMDSMSDADISFHEDEETFEYVYSRIMEESCFSNKRLHIISEWPKYNTTQPTFMKRFKEMLSNVPPSCVVVLYNLPNTSSALISFVDEIGKTFVFDSHVQMKDAGRWVAKDLAGRGIEIEQADATLIAKAVGDDEGDWKKGVSVDRLIVEIEKIMHYIGNRKKIKTQDIQAVCADSYSFVVFSLFKMFDDRDYCGAAELLNKSFIAGNSPNNMAFEILNSMQSRYSLIWNIKESLAKDKSADEIKDDISRLCKFERTGTGFMCAFEPKTTSKGEATPRYSRAYIDMLLRGNYFNKPAVHEYSRKEIFMILRAVHDTMKKIRVGVNESEILLMLDYLCMTACRYEIDHEKLFKLLRTSHDRVLSI